MTKHQMPTDKRDQDKSMPGRQHGSQHDRSERDMQKSRTSEEQQRKSPGRGDEGKHLGGGDERR